MVRLMLRVTATDLHHVSMSGIDVRGSEREFSPPRWCASALVCFANDKIVYQVIFAFKLVCLR